jgi:hypothetical protein
MVEITRCLEVKPNKRRSPKQEELSLSEILGLAETYLMDGAPLTALDLIRDAMRMADNSLPESEDLGDVSDHLLQQVSL